MVKMLYCHVCIDRDSDEVKETILLKDDLMKQIVQHFFQLRKLVYNGVSIGPHEVTTVGIIETDRSSSKLNRGTREGKGFLDILAQGSDVKFESKGKMLQETS